MLYLTDVTSFVDGTFIQRLMNFYDRRKVKNLKRTKDAYIFYYSKTFV